MEGDRKRGKPLAKRSRIGLLVWSCVCLTLLSSAASRTTVSRSGNNSQPVTAGAADELYDELVQPPTASGKSSNAISETAAEQVTFDSAKKQQLVKKAEILHKPEQAKSQEPSKSRRASTNASLSTLGLLESSTTASSESTELLASTTSLAQETTELFTTPIPSDELSSSRASANTDKIMGNELWTSNTDSTTPSYTTDLPSTLPPALQEESSTRLTDEEAMPSTLTASTTNASSPMGTLTLSPLSTVATITSTKATVSSTTSSSSSTLTTLAMKSLLPNVTEPTTRILATLTTPATVTEMPPPPSTTLTSSTSTRPLTTVKLVTTVTAAPNASATTARSASTTAETPSTKTTTMMTTDAVTFSFTTVPQDLTSSTISSSTGVIVATTRAPSKKVTLFLRIVFKRPWKDVCANLGGTRDTLIKLANEHREKKIKPEQIVFHQTQCSESPLPGRLAADEHVTTALLLFATDQHGDFDKDLTHNLLVWSENRHVDFPLPVESIDVEEDVTEEEQGTTVTQEEEKIIESGNIAIIVAVACVGIVALIVLAALIFIMRKRQGRFNYGERCRPVSLDAYSLDSVSAYSSVRRSKLALRSSKRSYGNPSFEDAGTVPTHPLNFAGLTSFSSDLNGIADEFAGIAQVSSRIDELPPGAEVKNRYANVIPLPETRVPLQRLNNDPLTEYINASYVRGPKNASKYYIASQAPTEATVCDFWRMIWEQQVKVIIMLTDLDENGVEKCVEYVPPLEVSDCHRLYGDYQVTLKKREAKDKYAISSLHLKNLENNTFREVFHIWYLWPVNGVPSDPSALIAVLIETQVLQRGSSAPILVHCSPGTGRTGTLIALDLAIKQYENTRTVDVPRVVYSIRRDRAGAVQTKEQYAFIYKAINQVASKLTGGTVDSP